MIDTCIPVVVPAYAGVDRTAVPAPLPARRCPRVRGGGPHHPRHRRPVGQLSPRTRGWTELADDALARRLVVPAYAGVDRQRGSGHRARVGCPRVRGGGPNRAPNSWVARALSPRTRGWTEGSNGMSPVVGVVPAYAGVDRARAGTSCSTRSLSPRTRGWTGAGPRAGHQARVVPAYAGVDRQASPASPAGRRCPRVRGGGPRPAI